MSFLGKIAKTAVGAGVGFLTGGPAGAVAGGVSASGILGGATKALGGSGGASGGSSGSSIPGVPRSATVQPGATSAPRVNGLNDLQNTWESRMRQFVSSAGNDQPRAFRGSDGNYTLR